MKAYLATSGVIFGLITLLHFWHAYTDGSRRLADPFFMLTTAIAAGLCLWSMVLLRSYPRL
jgi:hypothetical protein